MDELDFGNLDLMSKVKRGISSFVKKRMTMKLDNKELVKHLRRNNDKDRHQFIS